MKAADISALIENMAPLALQEEWDNSGYQIGSPEAAVSSLLIGFDPTVELIEEAVEVGADMVVTHHPLIFRGIKSLSGETLLGKSIIAAIKHDIVVYACHTNMDKVLSGVSGVSASRLGLKEVRVLDVDLQGNGLGVIGRLQEPVSGADFPLFLKKMFGLKNIRCSRPVEGMVSTVALCGGSGASLMGVAMAQGADAYVSADFKYHDFFLPDGFMIADVGHYETESDIVGEIYKRVKERFPDFMVRMGTASINPVYYY